MLTFLTAIIPALSESNDSRTVTKTQNGYSSSDNTINEYAPLIREDRVWEYVDVDPKIFNVFKEPNKKYHLILREIRLKFDGTKEIDGKTYHILNSIYVHKAENEHKELEMGISEVLPLAYMREENGMEWYG